MDREQGQPCPAESDSDALDQTAEYHQTLGLGKCRAGKENPDRKEDASQDGVDCPSLLASRGKVRGEYKTGYRQCQETKHRDLIVERAVCSGIQNHGGSSGRIAADWVCDENTCTKQTNSPDRNQ